MSDYQIVRLANGARSIRAVQVGETFHPVIGPAAEAEALYVQQWRLPERLVRHPGEFVVWDVGLGGAANALATVAAAKKAGGTLRLISFDETLEPLRFALEQRHELEYLQGFETLVRGLLERGQASLKEGHCAVEWRVVVGDFPSLLRSPAAAAWPKPHAILFDPFSPARNPAMWTLPLFTRLFELLDPARPCTLATYSRSTMLRVTWLLAGFYVGAGCATGEKEETTLAANRPGLVPRLLDPAWLGRARRSTCAEPLQEPVYRRARLSLENWEKLLAHPQFARGV